MYTDAVHIFTADAETDIDTDDPDVQLGSRQRLDLGCTQSRQVEPSRSRPRRRRAGDRAVHEVEPRCGERGAERAGRRGRDRVQIRNQRPGSRVRRKPRDLVHDRDGLGRRDHREEDVRSPDDVVEARQEIHAALGRQPLRAAAPCCDRRDDPRTVADEQRAEGGAHRAGADNADRRQVHQQDTVRRMTGVMPSTLRSELERGMTLPASWYSDPEILRLEHERIFNRSWQYAGRARAGRPSRARSSPVAPAGRRSWSSAVATASSAPSSTSAATAAHEVAQGCGRRETLQCPYHAWTYDLDGSLRAAPRSDREPGFDHSDWSLQPVLSTPGARSSSSTPISARRPSPRRSANYRVRWPSSVSTRPTLTYRGRSREWIVEANWKIVIENFLECYHCPVAHKSFSRLIDVDPDAYRLTTGRWSSSQYGPVQEPRGGRALPYDPVGEIRASQFHYVWPNWTLNTLPGPPHIRVLVFQPLDADRTASFVDGFWAAGATDETIEEISEFGLVVGQEDRRLVESVHRGLRSGAVAQGRLLLGSEQLIQHFQLLVHDALTAAG